MDKLTLRRVQLVQLDIAKEIKRVCEENGIGYFLDSGTLLGAVRHKGFIPWDDDLDMGMLRKDYEDFLRIAPQKMSEEFEIIDWENEEFYAHQFCKVIKKGTTYLEEKAQAKNCKNGIYVDIFAYDRFPSDEKEQRKQGFCLTLYRAIIRAKCNYKTWVNDGRINYFKFLKNLPIRVCSVLFNKKAIIKKYNAIAQQFNDCKSKYYFPQGIAKYGSWKIPCECLDNTTEIEFENIPFSAPCNYDLYLKNTYGDYMKLPPISERENRHLIVEVDFGESC